MGGLEGRREVAEVDLRLSCQKRGDHTQPVRLGQSLTTWAISLAQPGSPWTSSSHGGILRRRASSWLAFAASGLRRAIGKCRCVALGSPILGEILDEVKYPVQSARRMQRP